MEDLRSFLDTEVNIVMEDEEKGEVLHCHNI